MPTVKRKGSKRLRYLLYTILLLAVLINTIAFFHAYKFTHFSNAAGNEKSKKANGVMGKLQVLLTGVDHEKPAARRKPQTAFTTVRLQSNKRLEGWWMPVGGAKGSVVLLHGYGSEKSALLPNAAQFRQMGFNTFLLDFMGSGGSEGLATTIGFKEAEQVKTAVAYLAQRGEKNIVLYGTSMGAVAIMKAVAEERLPVRAVILECPFGTLLQTAQNRFAEMGIPHFPMANLLVFWGGVQNGYNAFAHRPVDYAKNITLPTLLLYGARDKKVRRKETSAIFNNLAGPKWLVIFPQAGHENYVLDFEKEWRRAVVPFMSKVATPAGVLQR